MQKHVDTGNSFCWIVFSLIRLLQRFAEMPGGLYRRGYSKSQLICRATTPRVGCMTVVVLCVFVVIILMPSSAAGDEAPPAAPTQTTNAPPVPSTSSPGSTQNAGAAFNNYADRSAPLLPADDDSNQALEVVPGTFGLPAAAPSTSETRRTLPSMKPRRGVARRTPAQLLAHVRMGCHWAFSLSLPAQFQRHGLASFHRGRHWLL